MILRSALLSALARPAAFVAAALLVLFAAVRAGAEPPMVTLGVASPGVRWSPGNWAGDSGRGGAAYRRTWVNGAYCTWTWSAASDNPRATLLIANPTPGSFVSYVVDGALVDDVPVPTAPGGIAIQGLRGAGRHVLTLITRNDQQTGRWSGANAYTVAGLTVNGVGALLARPAERPWVLEVGDSITEGIQAGPGGSDDNLDDYSYFVGQALAGRGYDYGLSACGYSGWIQPGDAGGDVPAYYAVARGQYLPEASRWSRIDAATSLLDARGRISAHGGPHQEPAMITINYGTNECLRGGDLGDMRASVAGCLAALRRAAAPATWIVVYVPFNLPDSQIGGYARSAEYIAALKAGVADYRRAHPGDSRTRLIDFGPQFAALLASSSGGGVHPDLAGHALIAARAAEVLAGLLAQSQSQSQSLPRRPGAPTRRAVSTAAPAAAGRK